MDEPDWKTPTISLCERLKIIDADLQQALKMLDPPEELCEELSSRLAILYCGYLHLSKLPYVNQADPVYVDLDVAKTMAIASARSLTNKVAERSVDPIACRLRLLRGTMNSAAGPVVAAMDAAKRKSMKPA